MSVMGRTTLAALLTSAALLTGTALSSAQEAKHPTDQGEITLAEHAYFFVGGHYVEAEGGHVMDGSMYVEHFKPPKVTRGPFRS